MGDLSHCHARRELTPDTNEIYGLTCTVKVVQREREKKLARFLKDFLNQYVSGDKEGFFHRTKAETKRLANTGCYLNYFFSNF